MRIYGYRELGNDLLYIISVHPAYCSLLIFEFPCEVYDSYIFYLYNYHYWHDFFHITQSTLENERKREETTVMILIINKTDLTQKILWMSNDNCNRMLCYDYVFLLRSLRDENNLTDITMRVRAASLSTLIQDWPVASWNSWWQLAWPTSYPKCLVWKILLLNI